MTISCNFGDTPAIYSMKNANDNSKAAKLVSWLTWNTTEFAAELPAVALADVDVLEPLELPEPKLEELVVESGFVREPDPDPKLPFPEPEPEPESEPKPELDPESESDPPIPDPDPVLSEPPELEVELLLPFPGPVVAWKFAQAILVLFM